MVEGETSWRPIWVRGGKVKNVAWIGKDVLAWCSGMHIVFFNISQKRETLRWCSKDENGDGVCCLSGHPTIHLLAFADKSFSNPKIFVLSYPSMRTVSECIRGSKHGYITTAFTPADNLISLGSYPSYSLIVWSWRTGDKLVSVDTGIRDIEDQMIRVSQSKPVLIAQLGRHSGKLRVWETSPAGKTIILTSHEIVLPESALPFHMDWSSDPNNPQLAVIDDLANIYIANQDGSEVSRIVLTQRCGICLEYEAPSVRWFRDGIVLRSTFCQIRFYKKDAKNWWRKQWYVKSNLKPCAMSVHPSKKDQLFYHTQEGFLMELKMVEGQDDPVIEKRLHYGGAYTFADFVQPWGHHLLAMDDPKELAIIDCYDGRERARLNLELEGEIMKFLSHPDYPMVTLASKEGELVLVSLQSPESPAVIAKFRLQNERLDLLRFSQCGKYLVAGQRTTGVCYCLSLARNKPFVVVARLETKCRMTDVLLYDVRGNLKLLVLAVTSRKVPIGHHLILYDLETGRRSSVEAVCYLELPSAYQFLHYAPQGTNFLIGTPYLSRQVHLLEIRDWLQVNLVDVMSSGHDVRRIRLWTDRDWITSAAFDGLVTLRDGKTRKIAMNLNPHHRRDLGVSRAMGRADLVVALGHDGSIVGMRSCQTEDSTNSEDPHCRVDFDEYERKKKDIMVDYSSLDSGIAGMLSKRLENFPVAKDGVKKTWIEWNNEKIFQEEFQECFEERLALESDFARLREQIVDLLNENEASPDIEKLPIADFDLDKRTRDLKMKVARDEREDARLELEARCVSMDKVTSWIKTIFWDPQKIIGRSVFAIFGDTEVTNYPRISDDPRTREILQLASFFRDSMRSVANGETFAPWKLYTPSKLQLFLRPRVQRDRVDETQRMNALLSIDDDDERELDPEELEDRRVIEGMTTHRFVEPSDRYFSQFGCYGFAQLLLNSRYLVDDCKKLREYFNKLFDDICSAKEREMSLVRERHHRIRYIDDELRTMFGQSIANLPIDPDWNWKEQPESIVKVKDDEVKVRPYVSQSQQELLDRQAFEAERLRLLLLADDFREKTLIKMMDGVLELRWEDVIKHDIPKPQCLLEKEPDEYNADDILAIRHYEIAVEHLESERTRYHRILEAELTKIGSLLRDGVDKFNVKIHDFVSTKMRVEATIQQLNLRNLREFLRHVRRMKSLSEDDELRGKIVSKKKILDRLSDELRTLHGISQEYRHLHEALVTREKAIEKKFPSDFPSLGKSNVELLEKECKRRPRTTLKNATAGDLIELGRIAASRLKVTHLTPECVEYLKNLDHLDARPVALPVSIENHHWDHLIRLRRNRIELEMKTRAQMAEITETEKTIAEHERKITKIIADGDSLKEQLGTMRQEKIEFDLDMEIQLVLKMGQIEMRPKGRRDDMKNVLLIPSAEIGDVNHKILQAGGQKLSTMNRAINFRRGRLFKEWEHKCLRMKIEDLEDEFHTVENVLVTREMREFLKKATDGFKDEKTPQHLERELEAMKQNCIKHLTDWVVRLEDVEAKVANMKRENYLMDRKIEKMNVDRWELEWQRDVDGEIKQREYHDRVMYVVAKRSRLVRKLHAEYTEVLALQTEHELLRLRRFPALNFFKTLDNEPTGC